MKLALIDRKKKKEVKLDIKIDHSYVPKDLLVIFIQRGSTCGLLNGETCSPYDEYCFKKIQNIITGSFQYDGYDFTIMLGAFLEDSGFGYFIIQEDGDLPYMIFEVEEYGDLRYETFKLCDYNEYKEICEVTGSAILSKKEFIAATIQREIITADYTLYNTIPEQKDLNLFLNSKDFNAFMDAEEIRTAK